MDYKNLSKIADSALSKIENFSDEQIKSFEKALKEVYPEAVINKDQFGDINYIYKGEVIADIDLDTRVFRYKSDVEDIVSKIKDSKIKDAIDKLEETEDIIEIELDGKPTEFLGDFMDGKADLTLYDEYNPRFGEEFTLVYPTVVSLADEQIEEIEEYCGRPLEEYFQIALKYGELQ